MKYSTHKLLLASCLVGPWVSLTQASAEEEKEMVKLEEIVVTALKQGTTNIETPAIVSVVDSGDFRAANITSAFELGGIVPGYVTMKGIAGASASIRGLGSGSADPGIEASVGTFMDGVFYAHTRDLIMPLYDIDNIQFIPGTQATTLGKNSSLGAVSITSRRPGDDFGFDVTAAYTTALEGKRLEGGIDIPLGENFSARLAGYWNDENGFMENATLNRSEAQLKEASGRLTIEGAVGQTGTLTFIYQHDDRDEQGSYLEVLSDPAGEVAGLAAAIGHTDYDTIGNDVHYSGNAPTLPDEIEGPDQFDDYSADKGTLIASFDIGSTHTLTSQTSYFKWNSDRARDLDFTKASLLDITDTEENKSFSQELRVSKEGWHFSYVAGAFYYQNDWSLRRLAFTQTGGIIPLFGESDTTAAVATRSWSGFVSGRHELNDRFSLLGGLRYTEEKKTATYERLTSGIFDFIAVPLPLTTLPSQKDDTWDWNFGIQFQPDDDKMLYATFAKGSKSGGYQSSPDTFDVAEFSGESAYTAEIGAKFDLNDKGFASFAIFNTTVKGFQTARVQEVGGFAQVVIDNSKVRSRGAEAAINWNLTPSVTLDASVTYADSKFREDLFSIDSEGNPVPEALVGMRLPRAPKWSARVAADYEGTVGKQLMLRAGTSLRYASDTDVQLRASNPLAPVSEAHAIWDARIAVGQRDGNWEVALVGNNLANERYVTFASDYILGESAYYGTRNRPRSISIQLRIVQ